MTLRTMGDLVLELARREKPEQLLHKVDGGWQATSSTDLVAKVGRLARGLGQLGVAKGDRVGLIATNGPLWVAIDLATLLSGGAMVAVDGAFTPGQSAAILNDSRVRFLFVEGSEQLAKVLALRSDVPTLEAIVAFGGAEPAGGALELESLLAEQPDCAYADLEGTARNLEPADLATIVYTSGTTSRPKGVMVSHRNLAFVIEGAVRAMPLEPSWTALSMLSLCYLFERVEDYAYLHAGCTIAYAESVLTGIANAQEVKPHVFVTVPRILERVVSAVEEQFAAVPGGSQALAAALGVAEASLPYRLRGEPLPAELAERLESPACAALGRVRAAFGGRLEFCMAGGAPLPPRVARFLWSAGVAVHEGYGLTETSPSAAVNRRGAVKLGTVGQAFPGVELRLGEEGEVLLRGPNVMMGYTGEPEEMSKVIDAEGWLHTGDLGTIDEEGFLTLTGRLKNVITCAYADKLSPEPVEHLIKESPYVQEAMIVGEGRPFFGALLIPDFAALKAWAQARGLGADSTPAELVADERVEALYRQELEATNQRSPFDPIDGFVLLAEPFTVQGGELTFTQKLRRQAILDKHHALIEQMYQRQQGAIETRQRSRH